MVKLEANLQFMFNEYELIDRYEQASKAGFKGVELQAPYSLEKDQILEKPAEIDLIYDIPKQKLRDWKNDLFLGTSLEPDHISAYSLTVEQNTALHSMVKNKLVAMPSETIDKKIGNKY